MVADQQLTVREAILKFYQHNNFGDDGGASKKLVWIKFGFISVPLPNTTSRSANVYLHDISHLVTGYDTTWKGESAVSAWEIASGGWGKLYFPWFLTIWAMGLGIIFYFNSTLKAFDRGLTMRNALTCGLSKKELYSMPVAELRTTLADKPSTNQSKLFWLLLSVFFVVAPPLFTGIIIIALV